MQKISLKKSIQIFVIIFAILLGIFTIFKTSTVPSYRSSTPFGSTNSKDLALDAPSTGSQTSSSPSRSSSEKVFVSLNTKNIPDTEKVFVSPNTQNIQTDSISLIAGDTNLKLKITSGQTLYEILQNEENKKLISFTGKKYTGIGFFVTDIGNLHQGEGKYLMYYINGIEASSGISDYVPKNGDIVEWKLK